MKYECPAEQRIALQEALCSVRTGYYTEFRTRRWL